MTGKGVAELHCKLVHICNENMQLLKEGHTAVLQRLQI